MPANPRAGQPALPEDLIDVAQVVTAYYTVVPDPEDIAQQVAFGTSGHRGSSLDGAFNEAHILATTQAIVEYRASQGTTGPLFIGRDTHGLSEPAWASALEVLAANDVVAMIDGADRFTPTPAVSHAILKFNRGRDSDLADGIVVTPSHNPPRDGGFKYNPPNGGPADTDATGVIAKRANEILRGELAEVKRIPLARALQTAERHDYLNAYVEDLPNVVDVHAIKAEKIRIGADPLGGASVDYWGAIAERHGLDLTVVNPLVDATWRFMTLDTDGKIRMDCSSPSAMASLIGKIGEYQIATGNDADSDRHGIVTPDGGLMNPNHFLAVAIDYLYANRPGWPSSTAVGKTAVSSSIIDRVVAGLGRKLVEVPVGFKWFVDGLIGGTIGFGGEESAGASFLRTDGSVWTTDKDGIILALLASEILAKTGSSPSQRYAELAEKYGAATYARIDAPANRDQKARLGKLSADQVTATELAGEPITAKLTAAPGNGAPLGGLKVTTENAWFAARPSGTEDVYKIYAESFKGPEHLAEVQDAAKELVNTVIGVSSDAEGNCSAPPAPKLPSEVWVLVTANAVIALGYGVVAPVLPQYARNFGVSIAAATFVITAFAVMRLCAAPVSGILVQKLGERRIYLTGLVIVAVSTGACAFAQTYWQLLVFRALGGFGSAMFTVSSLGLMIRISPSDARGRVAGLFSSAFLVGSVGGPILGSLTVGFGLSALFVIYGVALLIAAAVVFVRLRHSSLASADVQTEPAISLRTALRNRAYVAALFSNFSTGWSALGLRVALVPLFVVELLDRSPRMAGVALATFAIGNVSAVIPSGYLSDRIGRRKLMIVGLTVSAVTTVMVGFTDSLPLFLALAFVTGAATGMFISPQQAAVADIIGSKSRGGTAVATFQMMSDFGAILGSLAVGQIAEHLTYGSAFEITGAILAVAAVIWVFAPETRQRTSEHTSVRPLGPEVGGEVP